MQAFFYKYLFYFYFLWPSLFCTVLTAVPAYTGRHALSMCGSRPVGCPLVQARRVFASLRSVQDACHRHAAPLRAYRAGGGSFLPLPAPRDTSLISWHCHSMTVARRMPARASTAVVLRAYRTKREPPQRAYSRHILPFYFT